MSHLVTLTSGQFADLDLETLARELESAGYDGVELACWGKHLDIEKAYDDPDYLAFVKNTFQRHHLKIVTLSTHLIGQCVSDLPDPRLDNFAPEGVRGNPQAIHDWAVETMKKSAVVARKLGVETEASFTGSPLWRYFYSYPQTTEERIEEGFRKVREDWLPILDVFKENGVRFALEVHPAEIAFDYYSTEKTLEVFQDREEFGINFDPSHLLWQGVRPDVFVEDFGKRIYNVHCKDVKLTHRERAGLLGSYLPFGDPRRGWNFVTLGHGDVDFDAIIRALNQVGYTGPLTVEWEDSGMDRFQGLKESLSFVRKMDFAPSTVAFDAAISNAGKE
jgi:sugar phosphate isomerase/epimerase